MQKPAPATGLTMALVLAFVLLLACDRGPTGPSGPIPPPGLPPGGTVVVSGLEITGPATVAPDSTEQFKAIARYSNATTRDVTDQARWLSSDVSVLSISATGLATGLVRGEASITAWFEGWTRVKDAVMVLPPGTYRVSGAVRDAGLPVFDARVEVAGGPAQGLGVTANGDYRLYGVAGDVELRATRDGYRDNTKRLRIASHQLVDFDLELSAPREEISGRYTLTIAAADECRAALPEAARARTYTAVLTQRAASLDGTLEGAEFYVESYGTLNRFSGTVQPNLVTFRLSQPYDYFNYLPDVVERLTTPTSAYLAIVGDVVTTASSGRRSGALDGVIETMDGRFRRLVSCRSRHHQFVLSR
jgi:Big-like domain-containing protein